MVMDGCRVFARHESMLGTHVPLQTYITPRAILTGAAATEAIGAGWAWPLLGGAMAFAAMDVSVREDGRLTRLGAIVRMVFDKDAAAIPAPLRASILQQMSALAALPAPFAGLDLAKPALMGVLNVTPDSFSDGGLFTNPEAAVAHARGMVEDGAAIIDVGGESTRPGAAPVSEARELERVIDVVRALAGRGVRVSIDTRRARVMAEAVKAGAVIVNDVAALTGDPLALATVAQSKASVILMHMQGDPRTMQDDPVYEWAPGDIYDFLAERISACVTGGIPKARIAVDPGIGFGKTDEHNAQLMDHLAMFHGLGCALVLGASRKGFIGRMSRGEPANDRLPGSLAAALHAVGQGAQILRVHDVPATRQALAVAGGLKAGN
jgi:dihydropteroate synthase